ncbi:acyltransferase family protein [Anaerocolumna sp. AGMB13025]|uniref:acyltransferase family protein n=1 Tax=Anaerocolumna sp. AGMB13025 TaxID=3039116 RepID=UPI00241CA9ED|nr:acyltransferase family protein [Anaerocolumna sp. AGMB13025]WFR58424.1 acyltransferase family protein [Anaerocolumna sp. AGMB13025]
MQRDSYFDNFKSFLILLVVIGHFVGAFIYKNHFMNFMVMTIYTVHMPAFAFVSAYFSKRNALLKLIKTLLIPYFIFQTIYFIFLYTTGRDNTFELLQPYFTLWFMLSLFCWRLVIGKLIKIKGILYISYLVAILAGYVTVIGAFGAIERTITYLPFFLLGYTFDKEKFIQFADKKLVRAGALAVLLAILVIMYLSCENINFDILIMKYSYQKSDIVKFGWLYRTAIYIFSTVFIYVIAAIMPRKKYWFTYMGQRTMSIYLLHGLIYKILQYQTNLYDTIDTTAEMLMILLLAIFITFILSLKPFDFVVRKLSSVPLEKMLSWNLNIFT